MTAHLVDQARLQTLDLLGPTVQILTPLDERDEAPCLLRGTLPPGAAVPLHSHPDTETFAVLTGEVLGLSGGDWTPVGPGEVFHVPCGARHAWRNDGAEGAEMLIVTTARLGRFFTELADDATPARLAELAERYGHWTGTPEENAAVGIRLPGPS